jgi:hypothetical protein
LIGREAVVGADDIRPYQAVEKGPNAVGIGRGGILPPPPLRRKRNKYGPFRRYDGRRDAAPTNLFGMVAFFNGLLRLEWRFARTSADR